MKKSIVAILCLLVPFQQFATSIVILAFGNSIYAASDSKSTLSNFATGQPAGSTSIQKIFIKDGIGFAVSGHFDRLLQTQAEASIAPGRDILACIDTFASRMEKIYKPMMAQQKKTAAETYKRYLSNALADVAFFQVKNGISVIHIVVLKLVEKKGSIRITHYILKNVTAAELGFADHIKTMPETQVKQMMALHPGQPQFVCADMVRMELSNHPDAIGCPIKTLVWNPIGVTWGEAPCR
jgi:hypothetical protein